MQKEEHYARNDFARHLDSDAVRCNPYLASQPRVGLLSERWAWFDPFDFDHLDAVGSVVDGRTSRGWPNRFLKQGDELEPQICYA